MGKDIAHPTHLFHHRVPWRSQYQAFHPGMTPAACSPREDKDEPNLVHARLETRPGRDRSAFVGRHRVPLLDVVPAHTDSILSEVILMN